MLQIGSILRLSGYVTLQKFLQGRSIPDIERYLGFHSGRLSNGAFIAVATELPHNDGFELGGYSQVADHKFVNKFGNANHPKNSYEQEALVRLKDNARASWSLNGSSRLVKVLPDTGHDTAMSNEEQYPPGFGVPQWKILRDNPIHFRIVGRLDGAASTRFKPDEGFIEYS